jgi:hypothetical protein
MPHPTEVWLLYGGMAEAENQIRELKYDFGIDGFNLKDFYAAEAALIFAVTAYNLKAVFMLFVLQASVQHRLSTVRFRYFATGACFEETKGMVTLRPALKLKRRRWFGTLREKQIR